MLAMRRSLVVIALLCASTLAAAREVRSYSSAYEGIEVGRSTLPDVIERFGEPRSKQANSNNVRYRYRDFDMTIRDSSGFVDSIIIYDPLFRDVNGHAIGASFSEVERTPDARRVGSTLFDTRNGIVYWFKDGRVEKIVYVAKAQF